jgi:predicted anti-sigma-YlaC factor YlaD
VNLSRFPIDYVTVKCETAREAVSALLDDEEPEVEPRSLDEHLQTCADCRRWRSAAHEVTRNARLEPARPVTVPSDELVAAVLAHSRPPRRPGSVALARAGLVALAAAQTWITVPSLLLGRDHHAPEHIAHEIGAFAMALAVGFLVAAWRPDRARGMRTLVGIVAGLLLVTAALDLIHGRTDFSEEAPHLLTIVGWLLLVHVAAATPPITGEPSWLLGPVVRSVTRRRSVAAEVASSRNAVAETAREPARAARTRRVG